MCTCKAGKLFCKHATAIGVFVNVENTCSKTDAPMIRNRPPEEQLKKYSKGAAIEEILSGNENDNFFPKKEVWNFGD